MPIAANSIPTSNGDYKVLGDLDTGLKNPPYRVHWSCYAEIDQMYEIPIVYVTLVAQRK